VFFVFPRVTPAGEVDVRRVICTASMLLLLASPIGAQSGSAGFSMPRQTLDGGAATASSATFDVTGALGQPDAAPPATSPGYSLSGGFHRQATTPAADLMLSDGFESP
jgi:hypothetical protein